MNKIINKNLTWRELKGLHGLYLNGSTRAKIRSHPYVNHLFSEKGIIDYKLGNSKVLVSLDGFNEFYETHLKESYELYENFFAQFGFLKPQSAYKERDIRVLMLIHQQRSQIVEAKVSRKKLASRFFADSKCLQPESALEKAALNILGIDSFQGEDPKDQQYRLVLDCKKPRCIVLCENIDFLLYPDLARDNNIWLWHVGGNNIQKLDHLPPIELPIYYSCDWDYHGLKIYQNIKNKIPQIELLYPSAVNKTKPVNSPNHNSKWLSHIPLSGLSDDGKYFAPKAKILINYLIDNDEWIEEESNDLLQMLECC